VTYDEFLVHFWLHEEPAEGCPWCGPWCVLERVTLTDDRNAHDR
jgi:hypothetical protein